MPLLVLIALWLPVLATAGFDAKRSPFEFRIQSLPYPFEIGSVFRLPGESVKVMLASNMGEVKFDAPDGVLVKRNSPTEWEWRSPAERGVHKFEISSSLHDEDVDLNLIVMEPSTRVLKGYLNGYRIGNYPARPLNNNPIYRQPTGFVEVTKHNGDTHVSPHFRLEQFICKQQSNYPHYVVLNEELLLKLELILERINQLGHEADTLHVMSGYRTPYYNKAIGNVEYSLHQWGRAADVFVDDDENGMMDDLNKDGRIDLKDAALMRDIIQKLFSETRYGALAGGVGLYDSTSTHGPFVHVDARGYSAQW